MNQIKAEYSLSLADRLEIVQGDITLEQVDAIVNAANELLQHGAGVAAAIASAGSPVVQQESDAYVREHGMVTHEKPAYTHAGKMPAKWVLHAVGPIWGSGDEDKKLATTIYSTLALADRLQLQSVSFPAISTGIFGFPIARAARIFYETFQRYFGEQDSGLKIIRLVLRDNHSLSIFLEVAHWQFGGEQA